MLHAAVTCCHANADVSRDAAAYCYDAMMMLPHCCYATRRYCRCLQMNATRYADVTLS